MTGAVLAAFASPAGAAPVPAPAAGVPTGLWLVRFAEPPLARYPGDLDGLPATAPEATGARRLDPQAPAARAYRDHLERAYADRLRTVERALGRSVAAPFVYTAVYGGMALALDPAEAAAVAALPGVVAVRPDVWEPVATDAGPPWIGAPGVWDGTVTGLVPTRGEGVVVGVIDTGVNMDHPSFSDAPSDGHLYVNPNGSGTYGGWCDPGNPNFDASYPCNDKLIAAWDFVEAVPGVTENDGPEDDNGHGSHVASIAVGNLLAQPVMSGAAPHAGLITYDACITSGVGALCSTAAAIASTDRAVLDGVEVINYSAEGGTAPWSGDVDTGLLDAVAAGVFVTTSGGNFGPTAGTVAHLGPWVASVAAATHHRVDHTNQLTGFGGPGGAPATIGGRSLTAGYGPAPIVYAGDFSNGTANPEQCLVPFPPGTWTHGEIVVCDRGVLARVIKCQFAGEGGAAGCVLANVPGGAADLVAEAHYVPAIHIDAATGDALRTWLATGSGHTARITASAINLNPALGDVLGGFSSRGPAPGLDLVKPDLAAPGVQILAAVATDWIPGFTGLELAYMDGTSMASPHVAGAAALLTALHPGWSPPEILSALATTSAGGVRKENGVTAADPFDVGAGRIAPAEAARAGVVLDETAAHFLAADPGSGGDPRSLNLAGMADDDCDAVCGWSRTVESALGSSMGWTATVVGPPGLEVTVTPAGFTLAPGATRTLAVDLSVAPGQPLGQWAFATLVLTPSNPAVPTARLPIAVLPTAANVEIFSDGFESGDTSAWSATVP